MSLIQNLTPFHVSRPSRDFAPLFRLFDDYADHALRRFAPESPFGSAMSWAPKFDIQEKDDAYELHGELPGIEGKNVEIEFSDRHNLRISGHTRHESNTQSPSEAAQNDAAPTESASDAGSTKKATVEDEENAATEQTVVEDAAVTEAPKSSKEVAPTAAPSAKWVSVERSYGKFSRSFQFPAEIDSDNVKATLKDGVLNLYIPKAPSTQAKKVAIDSE